MHPDLAISFLELLGNRCRVETSWWFIMRGSCVKRKLHLLRDYSYPIGSDIWVFPKIWEKTQNHPFVHRVFHYFHHPFWGVFPYFWFNTHIYIYTNLHLKVHRGESIGLLTFHHGTKNGFVLSQLGDLSLLLYHPIPS